MKKHFYAVRKGRKNGVIVTSWDECKRLITGYPGAIYKGFALHQEKQAKAFAQSGDYGKWTPKAKKETTNRKDVYSTPQWPCLERKSYRDPFTGVYYKNRCVRRQGPRVVGERYKPHIGNSLPWRE